MFSKNSQLFLGSSPSLLVPLLLRLSEAHEGTLNHTLDLEEATEPPDLEESLANDNTDDEHVPPLDTGVGAFGGVAVGALAHDDV